MRYFAPLTRLWGQDAVRTAWARGNEAAVPENLEYFFSALPRLFDPAYVPTEQDIVRARARTIGITETAFTLRGTEMLMVDVRDVASKTSLRRHAVRSSSCSSFFLVSFRGGVPTRPIESHRALSPTPPPNSHSHSHSRTNLDARMPSSRRPQNSCSPPSRLAPTTYATPLASRSGRPPRASTCAALADLDVRYDAQLRRLRVRSRRPRTTPRAHPRLPTSRTVHTPSTLNSAAFCTRVVPLEPNSDRTRQPRGARTLHEGGRTHRLVQSSRAGLTYLPRVHVELFKYIRRVAPYHTRNQTSM
ncbi:G-protein alpha subunit-domain-containing protein [Mycena haematopus]|nr:G-protein alpha subunit-domain-containing protein [Mycena haematopus]